MPIDSLSHLWTFVDNGNWLGLAQAVFTGVVGELAYGMVLFAIFIYGYLRSDSVIYLMIIWVFMGVLLIPLVPMVGWGLLSILLWLGGGGLFFYLFMRVRG